MKNRIRKEVKKKRNDLSPGQKKRYAREIADKLFDTREWKEARSIMSYMDFMNEVETELIHKKALEEGKELLLPRTFPSTREMKGIVTESIDDYVIGEYGIREPKGEKEGKPDLVIVPGIAFDSDGNRIGYGGGYYDRYLEKIRCAKIAVVYDFQVYEKVEAEEHDIPVDLIITNS